MPASLVLPAALRSYLDEPAVQDAPERVWRDYAVIVITAVTAVLETLFRTDEEWLVVSEPWRWTALAMFFITVPPALWFRRSHPLPAALWGFGLTLGFGVMVAVIEGEFGGLYSSAISLILLYSLVRWGSGRHGAFGVGIALVAGVVGNLADPSTDLSDWIGGFIVLAIPIQLGLAVRYQRNARQRAIEQAKSLEREELARELHDTVAHHVSAIAVQAQAGQAVAGSDPGKAAEVLAVIEEAASRTLSEMRSIVATLRDSTGSEAEMAPLPDLNDLRRLANDAAGDLDVRIRIEDGLGQVGEAAQAALFRIARESLTNVTRHAPDATRVLIDIDSSGDLIRMRVRDNGASAQPMPVPLGAGDPVGYGLLGMAERAELLGGSLSAGPTAERSWQVVAELPRAGMSSAGSS